VKVASIEHREIKEIARKRMATYIQPLYMTFLALIPAAGLFASACGDDSSSGSGGSTSTSSGSGKSSSSSSGTGGGSGTAGGGQGGSSADACGTAFFCDDFEAQADAMPPGGKWDVRVVNGGAVVVDTAQHFSGSKAVKVSTTAGDGYKSAMMGFQDAASLPTDSNVVYGRMMFYLESAPTESVHWTFIEGTGQVPGENYPAQYRYGGQLPIADGSQLMANYDTPGIYQTPPVGPSTDCWRHSDNKAVPTGRWACAEWRFDGMNNQMQFWLDGTELPDLEVTGTGDGCVNQPATYTWAAPSFSRINLGWESYQPDAVRTMWIDDVALSTEQIGCPTAN
jgi:hypothetical protein